MDRPAMVTLTDAAVTRVRALVDNAEQDVEGLRIGVKTRGCSGMAYSVEYADGPRKFEEVVEQDGIKLFIDPTAVMFIIGSEVDYVEDRFKAGFEFRNPNEKGRCGCGESFHV